MPLSSGLDLKVCPRIVGMMARETKQIQFLSNSLE